MTARVAEQVVYLPLERLQVAETNPRKTQPQRSPGHAALRDSIRELGIQAPLIVVPSNGHFDVVCGYRRLTAARELKLVEAPCIVRPMLRLKQLELGLVDNLNRGTMDPVDVGLALAAMADEGLTQTEIAKRIGRNGYYVSTRIQLARMPAAVRKQVKQKRLTLTAALGYDQPAAPRASLFQRDEELQRAWVGLRQAVIDNGDRQLALAMQRFAGSWRAFGRAKTEPANGNGHTTRAERVAEARLA